jgi:hypothetical protein
MVALDSLCAMMLIIIKKRMSLDEGGNKKIKQKRQKRKIKKTQRRIRKYIIKFHNDYN